VIRHPQIEVPRARFSHFLRRARRHPGGISACPWPRQRLHRHASASACNIYEWAGSYFGSAALFAKATGHDPRALDVWSTTDPFFVNVANDGYRVRTSSAAKSSGSTLPADVASAVRQPAGVVVDRGAFAYATI